MSQRAAVTAALALVAACNGELQFDGGADAAPVEASADGAQTRDGASDGHTPEPPPACTTNADCKLASLRCDTVSGTCVACLVDADCTAAGEPRCDAALHRCVQCGVSGDCPTGQTCDAEARRCVLSCTSLTDCISISTPLCNLPQGYCIQCVADLGCFEDNKTVCDPSDGLCVECVMDSQCSGATPRCDPYAGSCVECLTSTDCSTAAPYCDPSTSACVGG